MKSKLRKSKEKRIFGSFASWEGGLSVRFELTIFGIGSTAFVELPQTVSEAISSGWVQKETDILPDVYTQLSLFCPAEDYTICVFFDDIARIAGLQIGLDVNKFSGNIYDWSVQGFTLWTTEMDGETLNLWTTQQYYITSESLLTDPAERLANWNSDLLLQDDYIVVSGFNGELYRISTNTTDITGSDSDFTEQACIPWMGEHYYYKMDDQLECAEDTVFPWFPLLYSDQLIGIGLIMPGQYTLGDNDFNWFENPDSSAVQTIVPSGPQCLYDLADSPGLVTMHTYFIKYPYALTCLW